MEKAWLCDRRLSALYLLVLGSCLFVNGRLFADEAPVGPKSYPVNIEVPIKDGNKADALVVAQKLAFEKAVEQALGANPNLQILTEKRSRAGLYVKSFSKKEEPSDGTILKMSFDVVVDLNLGATQASPESQAGGPLNIVEIQGKVRVPALQEALQVIESQHQTKPLSYRMSRKLITLEFSNSAPVEMIVNSLKSTFQDRADVVWRKPVNSFEPAVTAPNALEFSHEGPQN